MIQDQRFFLLKFAKLQRSIFIHTVNLKWNKSNKISVNIQPTIVNIGRFHSLNLLTNKSWAKWVNKILYEKFISKLKQTEWIIRSKVQQRYVLASMMFIVMGVAFALRISFPLLLTQMVYIPNLNSNNDTNQTKDGLSCPVKHTSSQNNTTVSVCNKYMDGTNVS